MNKISDFINAYSAWFPIIFLIAGIGFAILALIMFIRFHLASVIKAWLFHHGIWKKREAKESHDLVAPNNREKEDYQQEISRLFNTSGTNSGSLKQEASTPKTPMDDGYVSPKHPSDPDGTDSTTLLKSSSSDLCSKDSYNEKNDINGAEATTLLNHDEAVVTPRQSKKDEERNHDPLPDSALSTDNINISTSDINGSEQTVLLNQQTASNGSETTVLLDKKAASDGSDPTTLLSQSDEKTPVTETDRSSKDFYKMQNHPDAESGQENTDPEFKITRKNIFIHTDERI